MKKSTMAKLVLLVILALLCSPAAGYAFGSQARSDDVQGDVPPVPWIPPLVAQQYDADNDGALSSEEIEAAQAAILEQYDTDGDGELSWVERRAVRDAERAARMEKYDTDGDGVISSEEHDAIKADFIKRFDVDGDGALSKDELPDHGPGGPGRSWGKRPGPGGPWQ